MCYFIEIQDLAAYALVDLMEHANSRTVSFRALHAYGIAVVRRLIDEEQEAILLTSREHVYGMVRECSDYFEAHDLGGADATIVLRDGVSKEDLLSRFIGSIPLAVLRAMIDERSLDALKEAA